MDKSKFEKDIERLLNKGTELHASMVAEIDPSQKQNILKTLKTDKLPKFEEGYQSWYSEVLNVLTQLLPSRVDDFVGYYKPKSTRKDITFENYTVRDYLDGLQVTAWDGEVRVGTRSAEPKYRQQLRILDALRNRFRSSLYDLKTVVQADLFDNELDAAAELAKKGFGRAAGAMAGVVLEGHLKAVCEHHSVKVLKKNPSISDYNDGLKGKEVIDVSAWRNIQFLADLRNLCDHKKESDPKPEQVNDLIEGARKLTKTLF